MRERHTTQHRGVRYRINAKGERRYLIYYADAKGGEHTLTLPSGSTLEDARLKRGELMTRKSKGENLVPTKKKVDEMLDEWLDHRQGLVTPKTIKNYVWAIEGHLKPQVGHLRVRDLTVNDIVRLRTHLVRKGLKKWSIAKIETPLKNALTVAARDGDIPANPFGKLLTHERVTHDAKKPRAMSKDEIAKVLSVLSNRWRPLFATLIFTGLRIGEALALTWDDIDFTNNIVRVRKGKTQAAERDVMCIDALRRLLTASKLQQDPGAQFVFPTTDRAAYSALERACKKAGIPRYSPHELRHTFASILIDQGEPVTFVAGQLGHSDPAITLKVYAHLWEAQDRIDRARERLDEAMGGMI